MAANAPGSPADSPSGRILAVLSAVARLHAASVSSLAKRLDLSIATTHRICSELERLGYLQRVPGTRLWTVAHRLVGLAASTLTAAVDSLTTNAVLRELTEKVGEVSSFAVHSGFPVAASREKRSPAWDKP